jgi:hypothetical protein
MLTLVAVVFAVLAAFKNYAERRNTNIVLIADEEQSLWHHAQQADGAMMTQFGLRFLSRSGNMAPRRYTPDQELMKIRVRPFFTRER